jgi:hypothetical protein
MLLNGTSATDAVLCVVPVSKGKLMRRLTKALTGKQSEVTMEKDNLLSWYINRKRPMKLAGLCCALSALLAFSTKAIASEDYSATEWLQEDVQNAMPAAEILTLLAETVGKDAAVGANPGRHQLRPGLYVTAIPDCSNIILRFEVNRDDTKKTYRIAEVAITDKLGSEFFDFVQAALASAQSVPLSDAQPWDVGLNAESELGGQLTIKVHGDATAHFTVSWNFSSPKRPIDSFIVPKAFGNDKPVTEHINVTVHFPTSLQEFEFLQTIYSGGVAQRFHDLPLYPHTWLHLTVSNGSTNRYVIVHFDAITVTGQRLFVSQAPASTDVGGRFLDETLTRMKEMLNEEAAKPGSSGPFETSFPYEDTEYGVVDVVVTGEHGNFDVAYQLQTATEYVEPSQRDDY